MNVDKFIAGYKASKNKENYIKNIMGTTYVPFEHKIAECKSIINMTMYDRDENGNIKKFKQNTPHRWFLFNMALVKNYTKLELDDVKILEDFNKLCESGSLDAIKQYIPEVEYATFETVLKMVYDDEMINERDIPSWVENKIGTIDTLLSYLDENKEFVDKIKEVASKE